MNRSPKRVNIKDVAAAAEVSIATVSRVLNGKTEHIKPDTEKRVLKVVDELGYVPNEIARSLKISQSSRTIGLIVPCLDDILSRVAEGVFAEAAERGYGVYVAMVKGEQTAESCVRSLISRRAESIVFAAPGFAGVERILSNFSVPAVTLGYKYAASEGSSFGSVTIDNAAAAAEVARLAAARGRKSIAYITGNIEDSPARERYEGLMAGLAGSGIEFDEKMLVLCDYSPESAFEAARQLFEGNKDIDCIICGDDAIAVGAMKYCAKNGISVPQKVGVIGFGDCSAAKYLSPRLTTVRFDAEGTGRAAAKMLIDNRESEKPLGDVVFEHQLISRKSI
ncbi:MAG: LacI family DNA-binding transcriptional regulator [Clostridia bacterium]|nr:LacI family DNA-binding transcriptional regulator [Clostridia bacterium]